MNQTEFGNKIAELRKKKGLTQAELAEKCNLNIRSIQRIESAIVVPRAYTVKILSKELDSELPLPESEKLNKLKKFISLFSGTSKNKKYGVKQMENKLKTAWIAGAIMFVVMIPETILNIARYNDSLSKSDIPAYLIISIISAVTFIIFMYGFINIGKNLENNLIIICSFLFIFCTIAEYSVDFMFFGISAEEQKSIAAIFSVIYGFISIFFGIGLLRLESYFGQPAKYAGILEIIAGITFVLIILFFIGLFLLIPITILEIIILYKASKNLDWIPEKAAVA
jgi:transcriptional regulator with XRE-family HTH domain